MILVFTYNLDILNLYVNIQIRKANVNPVEVIAILYPRAIEGTTIWASEKVMQLVLGSSKGDTLQRDKIIRKLQHFCGAGFKLFMPETVKRECGKTFCIHINQFRIVGFLDTGYSHFIALDWFVKKTQQNDKRMNAIYQKVDIIRESRQWQKTK